MTNQDTITSIYLCLGERLNERAQRVSEGVNRHLLITFF